MYDRKNQTNSYDFLRITPVHALQYYPSTDPIRVIIAILDAELSRFDFSNLPLSNNIFVRSFIFLFIHTQRLVARSALARVVTYILS